MSQPRPSIIPADYDYSDYDVSAPGSGEAGSQEGLVTRRPHRRGHSRGGEDRVRGGDVYEADYDGGDIPVNWSRHRHPETRRSYVYKQPPHSYRYDPIKVCLCKSASLNDRRYGDQRSSDTVAQRSDDYGHGDYGHGGYHGGGGGCSLGLSGLCALLGVGALLAVGAAAVAAIVLTVTMGRRRRSFPDNSLSDETAAITRGEMLTLDNCLTNHNSS